MTPEEALKKYDSAAIDAALAIYFQIKKEDGEKNGNNERKSKNSY